MIAATIDSSAGCAGYKMLCRERGAVGGVAAAAVPSPA
jgi:hypothetical protein